MYSEMRSAVIRFDVILENLSVSTRRLARFRQILRNETMCTAELAETFGISQRRARRVIVLPVWATKASADIGTSPLPGQRHLSEL
jgi:hypothetical protein